MIENADSPPEPMEDEPAESGSSLILEPCLVCGQPARGLHFQVNACRACAAFFRRSIKSTTVYRCQRGAGNCDVTQKIPGKPLCRYCRLKKCIRIGMKIENPENKGENDQSKGEKNITTMSVPVIKPKDFTSVHDAVQNIYLKNVPPPLELGAHMTLRLSVHMNVFLDSLRPKVAVTNFTELNAIAKHEFFEQYLIQIAELTMHYDYFGQLPSKEKFLLFKHFWSVFHHIERSYMTIEFFGDDINDTRMLVDDKHSVDAANIKFNIPGKTPQQQDMINNLLNPLKEKIQCLTIPMKRLRMTMFEFCYVSQIILWSCFEIDDISPSTHKLADEIICKASNELHEYYVREMRISNYAPRQASLLKMISVSEFIVRDKKNIRTVNEIFNVFDVPFPDNGLS